MPQFGKTRTVKFGPTVSLGAYEAGESVGTGSELTFNGSQTRRAVMKSLLVADAGNQKAPLTIIFMNAQKATAPTDAAAFTWTAADLRNVVAVVNVASDDYETVDSKAFAMIELSRVLELENTMKDPFRFWVYVVTTGTPTYVATTDLQFFLGLLAD